MQTIWQVDFINYTVSVVLHIFYYIGGFSLVFLVKANNGQYYALKRISVNNKKDLAIGKLEIMIMVRF